MKNKTVVIIILLLAGTAFAVWSFCFKKSARNVIFISLDTTRADHLSCYGYSKKTTPNIDKFASESILFETVVSPIPMTFPSHSSIFTGTNPLYHGVHDNIDEHLDDYNLTLAEKLKEKGYTTGAIVSTQVLDSRIGISQGFDSYEDFTKVTTSFEGEQLALGRRAEATTDLALDWLDENSKDEFFLFVHYFDAHLPYNPPEPFATEYKDDLYAGEIAYIDHNLSRLFAKLKTLGLYDDAIIVIFGDHGEMLGEHGEIEHSYFIYESAVKVPMMIKPAGKVAAKRIKETVGLIDITPTVYSFLGIAAEPVFHGEDISRFFDGMTTRQEKRFYYIESLTPKLFECNSLLGVIEGGWKYIQTTRPELYNVANDRWEVDNLFAQEPHRAKLMKDNLQIILEDQVYTGEASEERISDPESIKELASLGYVGGGIEETFEFDQSKTDPKDMVQVHEQFKKTMKLFVRKEYDKALEQSRKVQQEYPMIVLGHDLTANIAFEQEDMKTAISNYLKAVELRPEAEALLQKLAYSYQIDKQHQKAVDTWQRLLAVNPDSVNALNGCATDLVNLKRPKLAIESWKKSVEIIPAQPEIHDKLAKMFYLNGNFEKVSHHWREAIKHKPDWDQIYNDLAWIYATERESKVYNPAEAVRLALEACRLSIYANPGYLDTLSVAYAEAGSYEDAIRYGEKAVEIFQATGKTKEAKETQRRVEGYK